MFNNVNKNNQNSQSEYLNHIVEQCLVHEFSHIVNSQSLADNDIPFLYLTFEAQDTYVQN